MPLSVPKDKIKDISTRLETIFEQVDLNDLGRSSGFVKRQRKVSGFGFARLCIQGAEECGLNASLTQLLAQSAKLGMLLSAEGLNGRFTASAECFMAELFSRIGALQIEREAKLDTLNTFSEILVEDSSSWQLPACLQGRFKGCGGGASKSGIKLNVRLDLKGRDMTLGFRHSKQPDSTAGLGTLRPQSLLLRDMGYFKIDDFRTVEQEAAFYVSRLNFSAKVYLSDEEEAQALDLVRLSRKMKVNEVRQMWCYVGQKERLRTRLVLQKVPKKVADAKRKKLKEDKQNKRKNLSAERLEFCALNAFLTNLPEEGYGAQLVMNLYSIRWMIEIIFKVWKSVYRIDEVRAMNEHRFMCLLYGKLIWVLLHHKLFGWVKRHFWNNYQVDVSELKGFKILQELKSDLQEALWNNSYAACYDFITLFYQLIAKVGRKQVRLGKLNQLLFYDTQKPKQLSVNQTFTLTNPLT